MPGWTFGGTSEGWQELSQVSTIVAFAGLAGSVVAGGNPGRAGHKRQSGRQSGGDSDAHHRFYRAIAAVDYFERNPGSAVDGLEWDCGIAKNPGALVIYIRAVALSGLVRI